MWIQMINWNEQQHEKFNKKTSYKEKACNKFKCYF
jgi:hypothetical protein